MEARLTLDEISHCVSKKYGTHVTRYKTCLIFHVGCPDSPYRFRMSIIEDIASFFVYGQKIWVIPGDVTTTRTVISKISQPVVTTGRVEPTEIFSAISFIMQQALFPQDDPYLPIVQKYKNCRNTDVIFFKDYYSPKISFQGNVPGVGFYHHHWRFSLYPPCTPGCPATLRFIWYTPSADKKTVVFKGEIPESEIAVRLDDIFDRQLMESILSQG